MEELGDERHPSSVGYTHTYIHTDRSKGEKGQVVMSKRQHTKRHAKPSPLDYVLNVTLRYLLSVQGLALASAEWEGLLL